MFCLLYCSVLFVKWYAVLLFGYIKYARNVLIGIIIINLIDFNVRVNKSYFEVENQNYLTENTGFRSTPICLLCMYARSSCAVLQMYSLKESWLNIFIIKNVCHLSER